MAFRPWATLCGRLLASHVFAALFSTYMKEGLGSIDFEGFYGKVVAAIPEQEEREHIVDDIHRALHYSRQVTKTKKDYDRRQ